MHSLVQTLLVTGSVQSLFLCGKCRCGTEQSAAENGRKSGRDREREHRKGNYFYRCRRDPSADGSPVFGSRRVRERLSFHRSYGNRVVPWNLFYRRNRNPGTGCTCRPGQPECTPWENYQLTKESPQLAEELASRAAEGAKELFAGELKVSVIIPSKDNPEVLEKCLRP